MITKFGKIRATRSDSGMIKGAFELEITINNIGGRNFTSVATTKDSVGIVELPYSVKTFRGINIENEDHLMLLLNYYASSGIKSYEWLEPLTEVPSQGGGSGLTIDDVYPIGIEITTTDTAFNPMKVWGGTWTVSPVGAKRVWTRTA